MNAEQLATVESWVTMVGEVSNLNVGSVLGRLPNDPDLVGALDAVLTKRTAWDQFYALREYLVGELFVKAAVPAPIVQRHPSPWDVPLDVVKSYLKGPKTIQRYFDTAVLIPYGAEADPYGGTFTSGKSIDLFTGRNIGYTERTNIAVGYQLPGYNLITSWWISTPKTGDLERVAAECFVRLTVSGNFIDRMSVLALLTPRPLFVPVGHRAHVDCRIEHRGNGTTEPILMAVYLEGWHTDNT